MALPSSRMLLIIIVIVAGLAYLLIARKYQRCPHCGTLTRRAVRGWHRCGRCGRQYHRSVKPFSRR